VSDIAIKVENLSKQYRLGVVGTGTISHDLNRWWARIRGKEDPFLKIGETNDRSKAGNSDYVWSLKDINFEVRQGEVLGIIGKNGAGKSTLLKILSKVTGPTTGKITAFGRIGALLEVGTGFHPELTGRENIFLNGAILGMTKAEIKSKLDEIVDFSGCARYVDTPVKRYSSGMKVRLAFAVAAFLEPEILIVDEVLAVGDAEFQKKAIGKMQDVSKGEGRTVLFVSHNMESVKKLCTRAIVLENGQVKFDSDANSAVNFYANAQKLKLNLHSNSVWNFEDAPGNENIKILNINVSPINGDVLSISSGIKIEYSFYNRKEDINLATTVQVTNLKDEIVIHQGHKLAYNPKSRRGVYTISFHIQPYILNAGHYKLGLIFGENARYVLWKVEEFIAFELSSEFEKDLPKVLPGTLYLDMSPEVNFEPVG
tara:strand:+ start:2542 stop:3822 length:1281 start_codon:yes stop_codon:yes gene_type:complete